MHFAFSRSPGSADHRSVYEVTTTPDEEVYDSSRLPPKVYLKDNLRLAAIIKEADGLPDPGRNGIAPVEVAIRADRRIAQMTVAQSTLVVRWQGPLRAKARLCIRGDMMPVRDQMSEPTPFRSSVRVFLPIIGTRRMVIATIDVSQAFLHAAATHQDDQLLAEAPDSIRFPRPKQATRDNYKDGVRSQYVFLRRPLYGLRESPLRWFIHISSRLRTAGYR